MQRRKKTTNAEDELLHAVVIDSTQCVLFLVLLLVVGMAPVYWWVPTIHTIQPVLLPIRLRIGIFSPYVYTLLPFCSDVTAMFLVSSKLSSSPLSATEIPPLLVVLLCVITSGVGSIRVIHAYTDLGYKHLGNSIYLAIRVQELAMLLWIYSNGGGMGVVFCVIRGSIALLCALVEDRLRLSLSLLGDVGLLLWSILNVTGVLPFDRGTLEVAMLIVVDAACVCLKSDRVLTGLLLEYKYRWNRPFAKP